MLQKTCPVHRRVVKWFSPFVMLRRRRGAAASAEDSFTYEMIRLGNSFRDGRRRKCTNLTEDDFWPRLCNLEGRVWTRASEMREREREREREKSALVYHYNFCNALARDSFSITRLGRTEEGGGSGSGPKERRKIRYIPPANARVRDSIYMLRAWLADIILKRNKADLARINTMSSLLLGIARNCTCQVPEWGLFRETVTVL